MLTLPLVCKRCGWRTEIRSDASLPDCWQCGGKLSPGGKVRPWVEDESASVSELSVAAVLGAEVKVPLLVGVPSELVDFGSFIGELCMGETR